MLIKLIDGFCWVVAVLLLIAMVRMPALLEFQVESDCPSTQPNQE